MGNVPFSRVIRLNVTTAFRWKSLLWTVVLFAVIGLFGVYEVVPYPTVLSENVWDVLFVTFSGPGLVNDSLFEFVHWFLPYLFFFYLFGNIAEENLSQRGVSLIPLIGSRRKWWLGEVVTLLILSFFYVVTGVATILIVSRCFLPWSTHLSPFLLSSGIWQTIPKDLSVATLLLRWIFPLFFGTLDCRAPLCCVFYHGPLFRLYHVYSFTNFVPQISYLQICCQSAGRRSQHIASAAGRVRYHQYFLQAGVAPNTCQS